MIQKQQDQHTRHNPSGHPIRIIDRKELHNTTNRMNSIKLLGRDVIDNLGLHLALSRQKNKGEQNLFNISNSHQKISKSIFHKYPHLCTRLGRSNNHVAKSTFNTECHITKHKERGIPLHLTEKVEN